MNLYQGRSPSRVLADERTFTRWAYRAAYAIAFVMAWAVMGKAIAQPQSADVGRITRNQTEAAPFCDERKCMCLEWGQSVAGYTPCVAWRIPGASPESMRQEQILRELGRMRADVKRLESLLKERKP